MRSTSGCDWSEAIGSSAGALYNYEFTKLTAFNGNLYVGTAHFNWDKQRTKGGELWRYTTNGVTLVIAHPALAYTLVYTDAQGDLTQINLPADAVTETVELLYTPLPPASPTGFAFDNVAFTLTAFRFVT